MKIKLMVVMCLAALFNIIHVEAIYISKAAKAPEGWSWNFEIKNKDKKNLYVTLQNGNKVILFRQELAASKGNKESDHGYLRLPDLNLGLPILITIEIGEPEGAAQGYMIERGAKERTVFVTYEKGNLRAQSGTGFFSKDTQSGLSLKKNIRDKDIERLPGKVVTNNLKEIVKKHPIVNIEYFEPEHEESEKLTKQIEEHTKGAFELEPEDYDVFEPEDLDVLQPEDKVYAKNKSMGKKQAKISLKI